MSTAATKAGRVESYVHSDALIQNKGGSLVRVLCQTEFAAKTDQFVAFSKKVAKMLYGYQADTWADLATELPEIEQERIALQDELKETITVDSIKLLTLTNTETVSERRTRIESLRKILPIPELRRFVPPMVSTGIAEEDMGLGKAMPLSFPPLFTKDIFGIQSMTKPLDSEKDSE